LYMDVPVVKITYRNDKNLSGNIFMERSGV
jgi:hypothetical protein